MIKKNMFFCSVKLTSCWNNEYMLHIRLLIIALHSTAVESLFRDRKFPVAQHFISFAVIKYNN